MNIKVLFLSALTIFLVPRSQAFYNPRQGRWQSRDPIEERGGMNILGFNKNNLIMEIDALGLDTNKIPGTPDTGGPYPSEPFPREIVNAGRMVLDKSELQKMLKLFCPKDNKGKLTEWRTCCTRDKCEKEADRIADVMAKKITEKKVFFGSWTSNLFAPTPWGRGCQSWVEIMISAYNEAINGKKAFCFPAGHLESFKDFAPKYKHEFFKIFTPSYQDRWSWKNNGIVIDPWQTGGASLFPVTTYAAFWMPTRPALGTYGRSPEL